MSERAEKVFKWYIAIVILATAFFLIYSPFQFKDRELYWREADYAAMAGEIDFVLPLTLAHGKIIPQTYPLFPWLAGYMSRILGFDMAFSLRFISVASLAIIALLVWETGRRAAGPEAAMVGVATVISANVMIEKGLDGYPNMTALMFLFAAWLVWFTFGVVRSHWNKAWIYSSLLCGLSFYTIGWSAIVYFFFPLIFMRRPLTLWPKLKKPGFAVAVGIILFFILFWGIPRWSVGTDIPFKNNPLTRGLLDGYFKHIIEFPFDLVIRFLPWSIIAWPPFCVAFFPLDKNPIFSRFMRIIFISLFFLLWFSPVAGTRDMIILLPPLSILIGMNYWLLARRYALFYIRFLKFFSYVSIAAGIILLGFYFIPPEWWKDFVTVSRGVEFMARTKYLVIGLCNGSVMILAGIFMLVAGEKLKLWLNILLIAVCAMLFFWGIMHPYKSQEASKREFAANLKKALGEYFKPGMTVYKDSVIDGLYGEFHYLGTDVKEIGAGSYEELPEEENTVFLVSTEVPIHSRRLWTNIFPKHMKYKDKKIYLWKGEKIKRPPKRAGELLL